MARTGSARVIRCDLPPRYTLPYRFAMARRVQSVGLCLAATGWMVACGGMVEAPSDGRDGNDPPNEPPSSEPDPALEEMWGPCSEELPRKHLRRLSNFQYRRAVAQLFEGIELGAFHTTLVGDNVKFGFDTIGEVQSVVRAESDGFLAAAELVSSRLASAYPGFLGCPGEPDAACVEEFALALSSRAFRRSLTTDEQTLVAGLARDTAAKLSPKDAALAVVEFVLQAPQFLYRLEESAALGSRGESVAANLSLSLWASGPDEALRAWARDHESPSEDDVLAKAREMLEDPRAQESFGHFADQWLDLEVTRRIAKDSARFPQADEEFRGALAESAQRLLKDAAFGEDRDVSYLFSSGDLWVNDALAETYGWDGAAEGWRLESRPEEQAAGILSHPAILVATSTETESSPILRGAFVRERILCGELPMPPAGVPELPEIPAGASVREVHELHMDDPRCNGCHQQIDPIGFGLENFDAIGRWRSSYDEGGAPVKPSGYVIDADDAAGEYEDLRGLSALLAPSQRVRACTTLQVMRAVTGLALHDINSCVVRRVLDARKEGTLSLRHMIESAAIEAASDL